MVVPCRDAAPWLGSTLASVVAQSRPPTDVVVVDDASADGSLDVARRFAARHPGRVRVVAGRYGSAAVARNVGAEVATGDAVVFLDADDLLTPDSLDGLHAALLRADGAVAVGRWCRLEQEAGEWRARPPSARPRRPGEDPLDAWLRGWFHPPCSVAWSREAFDRAGRWDERCGLNQDGDLMMRALVAGAPLVEAERGLGYYRRLPGSLSGRRGDPDGLAQRLRVVEKVAVQLEEQGRAAAHGAALADAAEVIAAEAASVAPDIARRARDLAAAHRGRVRSTVRRRVRPLARAVRSRSAASRPAPGPPVVTTTTEGGDELAPLTSVARPRVSVIVPTYERGALAARAVDSVLAQTFADFEVLVVDDGSTDDTRDRFEHHLDGRIRYVRQSRNLGVAAARNRGLREACGDLVAFLDSDDEWFPDKLARQVPHFDQRSEVGLVYGGMVDDDGRGGTSIIRPRHRGRLLDRLLVDNVLHGGASNVVVRRSVVAAAGFFDESLPAIEDWDWFTRVSRWVEVDAVDEPVARYHDPRDAVRRSLDVGANLEARAAFHRKHRRAMRRAGVEHQFLAESARRHQTAGNRVAARRLARSAVRAAPGRLAPYRTLARTLLPAPLAARLASRFGASPSTRHEPLRVAVYSSTSPVAWGGVQAVIDRLIRGLRHRGHAVGELWAEQRPDVDHAGAVPLPLPSASGDASVLRSSIEATRSLGRLATTLRRFRPDVVNVHFLRAEVLHFLLLRPWLGYRLVLSAHGSDVLRSRGLRERVLLPLVLPRADAVVAVSEPVADHLRRLRFLRGDRLHVIPNGVDVDFWAESVDGGAALERRGPVAVSVGRLERVKGHDVLVRAWPLVLDRVPGARLVIIGEGEELDRLRRLSEELGVDATVTFAGHLDADRVRSELARGRALVLPSRSEGMPLALLEGMAAGLAPVASSVGGVPAVLVGDAGLLVPPDDPRGLADAVARVLVDDDLAASVGDAARRRAGDFSADRVDRAYERLFREVVDGGGRRVR